MSEIYSYKQNSQALSNRIASAALSPSSVVLVGNVAVAFASPLSVPEKAELDQSLLDAGFVFDSQTTGASGADVVLLTGNATSPGVSPAGSAWLWYDSALGRLRTSLSGAAAANVVSESSGSVVLTAGSFLTAAGFGLDTTAAGALKIGAANATSVDLATSATTRWTINSSGHLVAGADATYTIGALNATRPSSIYAATSLVAGTTTGASISVGANTIAATQGMALTTGDNAAGSGYTLSATAGGSTGAGGAGGAVTLLAGPGNGAGPGGSLSVTAGSGGATGAGGVATVSSGSGGATSGDSGALNLATGVVASGTVGSVNVRPGGVTAWSFGPGGYLESVDGSSAAVSGASTARIRYNNSTGKLQLSTQGGAYADIATGGGSGPFTNSGTSILTTSATYDTLVLNDATTSAVVARTIKSPDGTASVNGSSLTVRGGAGGSTTGNGGSAGILGGSSTNGQAGTAALTGGTALVGQGGSAIISGGSTSSGPGGTVTVNGGAAVGGNNFGGSIVMTSGASSGTTQGPQASLIAGQGGATNGAGGTALLRGGASQGSGAGGDVSVAGGQGGATGTGGAVLVNSGAGGTTSGNSGAVNLATGTVTSGTVGSINVQPGGVTSWSFGPGGYLEAVDGSSAGFSGASTGRFRYNNSTGKFQISAQGGAYADVVTGSAPFTTSGTTILTTSATYDTLVLNNAATSSAVSRTIKAPDGTTAANGSSVTITGGAGGATVGTGGAVSLTGGAGTGGDSSGGTATVQGGAGQGSASGAAATVQGGAGGATGNGANVILNGGLAGAAAGTGGEIVLQTARATAGTTLVERFRVSAGGALVATGIATASAPAVSASGVGRLYFNSTQQRYLISENTGAYRLMSPFQQSATATGTITTTSLTDVLATGMTITPEAGTYLVWFSCTAGNSTGTSIVYTSIYAGGSQVANSERNADAALGTNWRIPYATVAVATVNGAQAIEGRWRVSANTGSMVNRTLIVMRIA